ncbi:DUF4376 domain-containing protein [Histophilus somni]|uniref:DUF4376 domain-containing protein n=1 Tax=Histophilus somni TaxID=731 RepID=UPI00109C4433|nr:DUF4376 domain-containing protein [Histophilus somni]THA20837.1 DUF4376 domain-containing protein [Histophilus somni]
MKIYFKDGFYMSHIHKNIPQGAVEISEDLYRSLLMGQSEGKQIITDENGYPQLAEPQPSPFHHIEKGQWVISPENQTAHLTQVRAEMREKINALRDEKINGGVFVEAVGKWIDTDATAERNILSVKASYDLFGDMEIAWTCADNSVLMINKEKLTQIWQALMNAKTSNHANALKHKTAMEQSDNPAEYDYSSGWTKCYQDYLKEQNDE